MTKRKLICEKCINYMVYISDEPYRNNKVGTCIFGNLNMIPTGQIVKCSHYKKSIVK